MRIFVLEDMSIRHNWFRNQFKNDELVIVEDAKSAIDILSKDLNWDIIFLTVVNH